MSSTTVLQYSIQVPLPVGCQLSSSSVSSGSSFDFLMILILIAAAREYERSAHRVRQVLQQALVLQLVGI
jgi:hypothetical protein